MLSRSLESRNPSSAVNHGGFELSMHRSSASEINMRDSSSYGRVKSDKAVPRFLGCVDLDITQGGDVYLSGEESTKFKVSFYRLDQQNSIFRSEIELMPCAFQGRGLAVQVSNLD